MVDSAPLGSEELPPTGPEPTPDTPSEPPLPRVEPEPPEPEPTLPPEPTPPESKFTPPQEEPILTGGTAVPPPPPSFTPPRIAGLSDNDRIMAALAYFLWFIGAAIILLSKDMKDQAYMRYHAIQGLGLSVVATAYSVIAIIVALVMSIVGVCCCFWVLVLPGPVVTIYYAYRAYQGEYFKIPVLTNIMVSEGWLPK
jgi:uncharacterized membrane protein